MKIKHRGQALHVIQWARSQSAIPENTFLSRYRKGGWTIPQLMGDEPRPPRRGQITYKGENLTPTEWAKRAGISKGMFCGRRRNGWTMPQLMGDEPPPERKPPGTHTVQATPEMQALARVRENLAAARRELVTASNGPIGQAIAQRIRRLISEEDRLVSLMTNGKTAARDRLPRPVFNRSRDRPPVERTTTPEEIDQ